MTLPRKSSLPCERRRHFLDSPLRSALVWMCVCRYFEQLHHIDMNYPIQQALGQDDG